MSFLDNVKQSLGYRARETKPATGYSSRREWGYISPLSGKTGIAVTPDNALTFSAIYSAVSLLVTTTSSLKLCKFKVDNNGNRIEQNDLFNYVHNYLPNPEMDARTYNEAMTANLLLRGEAFAENEFNELGEVVRRWPIPSQYITPYRTADLSIWYLYTGPNGTRTLLPAKKVFHVKDFSLDGFRGISRISLARLGIELGLAQENLAVALMGNDARPQGVINVPEELDPKTLEEFKVQWHKSGQDALNKGRTVILENGMKYQAISMTPKDTEFIASRHFQIEEIARWFRVPPHMLYDLTRSTYSNINKQSDEFATYSLMPILDRFLYAYFFETFVEKDIAKVVQAGKYKIDVELAYDLSNLLRADSKTRHEIYNLGMQNALYSINDCLRMEKKDTIGKHGEIRWVATNRVPLEQALKPKEPKPNGTKGKTFTTDDGGTEKE